MGLKDALMCYFCLRSSNKHWYRNVMQNISDFKDTKLYQYVQLRIL